MIVIDTTVWIQWFRLGAEAPWHDHLSEWMLAGEVAVVPAVLTELLIGARGSRERRAVIELASSVRVLGVDPDAWIAAGELGRRWRSRGRTLSVTDCLLASEALRCNGSLWTLDQDFEPLFEVGELRRPEGLPA